MDFWEKTEVYIIFNGELVKIAKTCNEMFGFSANCSQSKIKVKNKCARLEEMLESDCFHSKLPIPFAGSWIAVKMH